MEKKERVREKSESIDQVYENKLKRGLFIYYLYHGLVFTSRKRKPPKMTELGKTVWAGVFALQNLQGSRTLGSWPCLS